MNHIAHLQLLARYNQWMNDNLFAAAATLPAEALALDQGAFFGSILGTFNHLAVGDTLWLKRFATHPSCADALQPITEVPTPKRLNETLFGELGGLRHYRTKLDELIVKGVASLHDKALTQSLTYKNTKGIEITRNFHALLIHFFNHQTHHRGQVTTLLFQAGVDPGITDLFVLIPDEQAEA